MLVHWRVEAIVPGFPPICLNINYHTITRKEILLESTHIQKWCKCQCLVVVVVVVVEVVVVVVVVADVVVLVAVLDFIEAGS